MSSQPTGSGSGSRSSSDGDASPTLSPIAQRPSLTTTPSTQPLMAETPIESVTPIPDPFSSRQLEIPGGGRAESSEGDHEGGSDAPHGSSLRSTLTSGSGVSSAPSQAAPKIRINDMPNSPPVDDDESRMPTPPAVPPSFTSPFAQPAKNRGSAPSMTAVSPTTVTHFGASASAGTAPSFASTPVSGTFPHHQGHNPTSSFGSGVGYPSANPTAAGPSTTIPGPAGISAKTTGIDLAAGSNTKGTIASRRALRMKQAISTSGSRGSRLNAAGAKHQAALNRKPFQSTRLKGEIYKPWLEKKDPAMRWARWITIASIFVGFAVAGVICWDGYRSIPSLGKICSVLDDDFSSGEINPDNWEHEVRLDGYGSGSFQWTTASSNNSYVKDGVLYLVPTLTSNVIGTEAITNGYTLNLTADGTCTSDNITQCVAVSNSSRLTVINPVQSARLITKNTATIKYGKVEVRARFPSGDWLWPRIQMLPVEDTYGAWPRSGQIDILTGRGNNASYPQRGVDYAQSDIHWGPITYLDRLYMTWGYREQRRTYYSQKYHTFGLEWNDEFMWTYIDSRVSQVISLRFAKESFWTRGKFPTTYTNGSEVVKLTNPWSSSENNVAPFDQPFYLAIDLAVGSGDGWFPDGEGGKPWTDDSASAMSDFWAARSKWAETSWSDDETVRGFAIDSVKMWKTC
ncbi:hypothetical protein IAT38_005189 [Cryptococcus sp. DSM 104549]